MPKFQVEVTWRTVHVQRAIVSVEADDKFQASDLAYDLVSSGEEDPEWGAESIVEGDYIVNTVEEIK